MQHLASIWLSKLAGMRVLARIFARTPCGGVVVILGEELHYLEGIFLLSDSA